MKYKLEFEAPDNWKPLISEGCWVYCPLASLTKLGNICRAKKFFDKEQGVICPIIKLSKKKLD